LNTTFHGSFLHLTSSAARTVLNNIIANTNDGPLEEETLEEEIPEIATPEPMPETSQPIAIQHIESPLEEILLPDFINDIEDDLFSDYGNTSKYLKEERPQKDTSSSHEKLDRSDHNMWLLTYYVALKAAGGNYDHMAASFPLVISDTVSLWLNNLSAGSIMSWADLP
jgi:hypothetical protein